MEAAVTIGPGDPLSPEAAALIAARDAEYRALYPPGEEKAASGAELAAAGARFLLARADGRAVGCAGFVPAPDHAELKSLYVLPERRGTGLGRRLLAAVEAAARAEGHRLLKLETGTESPEAQGLYSAAGYRPCGRFGAHPGFASSIFLEKRLSHP